MLFRSKLPVANIKRYLNDNDLYYIRHYKVQKSWNPSFEKDETVLNFLCYTKNYYKIDATDLHGNPVVIDAILYRSYSFFS